MSELVLALSFMIVVDDQLYALDETSRAQAAIAEARRRIDLLRREGSRFFDNVNMPIAKNPIQPLLSMTPLDSNPSY